MEEKDNKAEFVETLGAILKMHSREAVEKMTYINTGARELVEILFTNGYAKYADVTGDSCIAIMSDVYKAMR